MPSLVWYAAAHIANEIEYLSVQKEENSKILSKISYRVGAAILSLTVFPLALAVQLVFKQTPKTIRAFWHRNDNKEASENFRRKVDKLRSHIYGILATPLALYSADAVSSFFVKDMSTECRIKPFGVEYLFGTAVDEIHLPDKPEKVCDLVNLAKEKNCQISVIGAGMSQGTQTVPEQGKKSLVINTKKLNHINCDRIAENLIEVESGATWEQVQLRLNSLGKSVIVKQASDIFSAGGTIGMNAHGWAHEHGAIAYIAESIRIVDANGDLRTVKRGDELFNCMFGTMGYFAIIISATLKITDNAHLIEKTEEIDVEEFHGNYQTKIKGRNIPLFGGRLDISQREGIPFRKVCMVRYEYDSAANKAGTPVVSENFIQEARRGTRMERIALQIVAHASDWLAANIINKFWQKERQDMLMDRKITRNEALHPPINAFTILKNSNLHAQWLQEYFIKPGHLATFLHFLGEKVKAYDLRIINATIRPTPKDSVSILPYAEQERYAVVICFSQYKTESCIAKTKLFIETVNAYLEENKGVFYQAYMPYATRDQFEACYGKETLARLRALKEKYDPDHVFGNAHTAKYYDA